MHHHQSRHKHQKGQVDYFLLLLVILIGVTGGILLANWISARIVAYQLEQSVVEISEQLASDRTVSQQQTRTQRAGSQTGQFLFKSCEEWKTTHQRYDNFTSQQEMRKACNRYEKFLESGVAPIEGFN